MSESRRKREERRAELKTIRRKRAQPTRRERERREERRTQAKPTPTLPVKPSPDLMADINKMKSDVETLQQREGTTKQQQEEIRQIIKDIETAKKKIKGKSQKIEKIKKTAEKIKKIKQQLGHKEPKIDTRTRYKKLVDSQVDFMAKLVHGDVVDKSQAKDLVKELTPTAAGTVTTEDHAAKFMNRVENKLRYYEGLADYKKDIGIKELTGPDKKENINKVKARFAHMTMATAIGFVATAPIAALSVAGPAVGGLIAAASVATVLNPGTRAEVRQFIEAHPEEFLAGLGGALLAGATVSEVNKAFKTHTKNMKIKDRRALEKKLDKMIDDISYAEQHKGARYPSRLAETLEPEGWAVYVTESPFDKWEQYASRNTLKYTPPEDIVNMLMKQRRVFFMYGPSVSKLKPVPVDDLLVKYPELKDPYFNPALKNLEALNKDLVARSNLAGVNYTPLLAAALSELARKGYITDADIKRLIKENRNVIEEIREKQIQVPGQFSKQALDELNLVDLTELVDQTPDEEQIQLPDEVQKPKPDQIQEPDEITIPAPPPPGEPEPPPKPRPEEPELPPETPKLLLTAKDREALRRNRLRLFNGPKAMFKILFKFPRGASQTMMIEARSFVAALGKAQRKRRSNKHHPSLVDITRIKG